MSMAITDLTKFVEQFTELLAIKPDFSDALPEGQKMLSELTASADWFQPTLAQLILSEGFLQAQFLPIDPNDIQLYYSPDKSFSVRAFIWEPNIEYPIHDHGAWGMIASFLNQIKETKYKVSLGQAELSIRELIKTSEAILSPGETSHVPPLDKGIHQMKCVNNDFSVTIHIYGPRVRRGYIQEYNPVNKTIRRIYRPLTNKKVLAIRTLGSMTQSWAKDILQEVLQKKEQPDYIKKECMLALDR
jgi:predicted metal-dependent enzyme (double-stranded beta helix superfamily)